MYGPKYFMNYDEFMEFMLHIYADQKLEFSEFQTTIKGWFFLNINMVPAVVP